MESGALLIFLAFLFLVVGNNGVREKKVSGEEDVELERQLKILNKPAIKTIKTKHGDIFDCVGIYEQPAFKNPLLKNHKLKMKPSFLPKKPQQVDPSMAQSVRIGRPDGGCPEGYVPVRRTQKADLLHTRTLMFLRNRTGPFSSTSNASMDTYFSQLRRWNGNDKVYGTRFHLNIWGLQVEGEQRSAANTWVENDCDMINAGWIADPSTFSDTQSRLFAYWTADCDSKTGCFNTLCPGFVQIDGEVAIGSVIEPVSEYQGPQYEIHLDIFMDLSSDGTWWLVYGGDKPVGYWPLELFSNLSSYADLLTWGGWIDSPIGRAKPPIGSSQCALEGFRRACYIRRIQLMDLHRAFYEPQLEELTLYSSPCYETVGPFLKDENWRWYMYFGGPEGCPRD